ncbi:hypothetical protein Tco_0213720 [Tanacetum coccineum]
MKGLSECKASERNIRRTQVKDIIKEVEDYLKTYSSTEMDISWYVKGICGGSKESQRWQYSDYPITLLKKNTLSLSGSLKFRRETQYLLKARQKVI